MCPLGIVPPLTTRERRNSCIVGFSDLFSGLFAAVHALSTHGRLSLSLRELECCTWMKSLMSVVSLTSKRIHPFTWCVKQLKGAYQELSFGGDAQQHYKLNKILQIVICMELPGTLLSPLLWCNATWLFLWFYF